MANTDFLMLMMRPLPTNVTNNLNLEAATVVSSLSIAVYVIFLLLMIYYYCRGDENICCLGSPNNSLLLFLGFLVSTIVALSVPDYDRALFDMYSVILLTLVGMLTVIVGSRFFFKLPATALERPLSFNHKNMSLFIWIVTIPLVLIELVSLIGAFTLTINGYGVATDAAALAQKLLQASVYHFSLRLKVPRGNKKEGAAWYFRVISLFNYAMWLDSIIRGYDDTMEKMFGIGFSVLGNVATALLIDYRLLCCLLFAEHSLEVYEAPEVAHDEEIQKIVLVDNVAEFELHKTQLSGLGYVFGITLISFQLICGLQYYGYVGLWSNIFPIIADLVVVILGFLLLRQRGSVFSSRKWRKTEAKGVDMMVAMMGITGFLYWLTMSIFNVSWAHQVTMIDQRSVAYLKWSCAKNVVRSVGIFLQLFIFVKCDPFFGCSDGVKDKKSSYFILPAIMLSFLSVFVMAIMDSHSRVVKDLTESSSISRAVITMMEVSEPLYLGFCLHLFLHFFIVNNNMRSLKVRSRQGNESTIIPLV